MQRGGELIRPLADMHRRWLVIAIFVGLLGGTLAIAQLWVRSPDPGSLDSAPAAEDAPEDPDPDAIPWVFFSQLPPDGGEGSFVVQAGLFGDPRPRVDIAVPWTVDHDIDVARMPAVARPAGGAVVYVADDGTTSVIHRVAIAGGAVPEAMATVDDTVWSIAAAPDGSAAYLALAVRGRPDADLGVVRVRLDGSGAIEPVLPAMGLREESEFRLAAVAPFTASLDISADGRYLGRTACRGVDGCVTEIVDLTTSDVREVDHASVIDLGTGGMIVAERCNNAGCTAQLIDLISGASLDLLGNAWDTTVINADGGPVAVGITAHKTLTSLALTDPVSGERRELYRAPEQRWLALGVRSNQVARMDGAVLVIEGWEAADGMHERYLLVPFDGGAPLELPPPAIRQIAPAGPKG
jgi:hypothetical protein